MGAGEVWDLAMRMKEDEEMHIDYLVRKMGFYPEKPEEVSTAYKIMLKN